MALLALLPITILLTIVTKNKTEYVIFPLIVFVTTIMMFFALSGNIMPGVYLTVFISVVALIADCIILVRSKGSAAEYFFTPGLVAFVIGSVLLWILCNGRQFITANELVFTGPAVRYIFDNNSFAGEDMSFWDLNDTFPFIPLWCCFFMKLGSGFREDICIFAKDIFVLSGFVSVFGITGRRRSIRDFIAVLMIVLLIPVIKIQEAYATLDFFVPQAAALFYTLGLLIKLRKEKSSTGAAVAIVCGVFASCVTTRYGAFAAIPVMTAGLLVSWRKRMPWNAIAILLGCLIALIPGKFRFDLEEITRIELWYPIIALGLSIVLALVILCMFELIRKNRVELAIIITLLIVIGICYGIFFYVRNSSVELVNVIEWMNEYNKKIFTEKGEEEYLMGKYAIGVYDMFFLIAAACFSAYLFIRKKQKCDNNPKKERLDATGILVDASVYGGIFVYLNILSAIYVMYLRSDGADKPIIAGYIFPAIAIVCCTLISDSMMIKGRKRRYVLPAGAIVLSMLAFTDPIGGLWGRPKPEHEIIGISDSETHFNSEDKVFYIDPEMMQTKDFPAEFKWKVFPAEYVSLSGLYFTPNPQDWSKEISAPIECEELERLIRERQITYVYLRKNSDYFFESYWPLFDGMGKDIDDESLYKVTYDSEDIMILKVVK